MLIRPFTVDDADALRQVFHSSVHYLARHFYSPAQLNAWAPERYDRQSWLQRLTDNRPFVAVADGQICGFADVQDTGYIDQFFVAGAFAGRGVGTALMRHLLNAATDQRIDSLHSHVSLAAERFFSKHGFSVTERRVVSIGEVQLANARMERTAAGPFLMQDDSANRLESGAASAIA